MFIVWRGRGPIVFLFILLAAVTTPFTLDLNLTRRLAAVGVDVPTGATGVVLTLSGMVCVVLGWWWNAERSQHSLYWLPVEVWGYLFLVGGFLCCAPVFLAGVKHLLAGP